MAFWNRKSKESKPAETSDEKPKTPVVKDTESKPTEKPKKSAEKQEDKVWHITKRASDGMWQVKKEGGAKATKLFRTKAEAEEYVKGLKSNNEGSRVVAHKKTGEFQKK